MKKSIFISVFLICFISISSIAYALSLRKIIPLDIISNLINNILGTTSTTTVISVDTSKVISTNKLSLGFQVDGGHWKTWRDSSAQRQLAKDAGFKLIRVFDWKSTSFHPCTSWNETKKDCNKWNWADVDSFAQRVFEIGAEPMFTLGGYPKGSTAQIPSGMTVDPNTGLPRPDQFAAYATAWVSHFKQKGLPVRFYEIFNEIQGYLGDPPNNAVKIGNFMALVDACVKSMKIVDPNLIISFDFISKNPVLNYWLNNNGPDLDSLNFHKYDSWNATLGGSGYRTDQQLFGLAEQLQSWYNITDAEKQWYQKRGEHLPMICSESNLNGQYKPTTDPRIQQMSGATWLALILRSEILQGVSYHVYFEFASGIPGFGMVNSSGPNPWYPYYVHKMIGTNLAVGDSIVSSSSNYNNVSSIAWIHSGKLNILLIHKSTGKSTISLSGITGQLTYQKIDDPSGTTYLNPTVQTGIINAGDTITLNGYTVMLLQPTTTVIITKYCSDGTSYGKCSSTKPKYCDSSGVLHDNYCYGPDLKVGTTDDCGCLSGSCQADGTCKQSSAQFQVTVDTSKAIGINNLLLGFQFDKLESFQKFRTDVTFRQMAQNANFKLVRFFEHRPTGGGSACNSWSQATKSCTSWNWASVDSAVSDISSVGAKTLIVLGFASGSGIIPVPKGMSINSTTGLPYPDQWAAYCAEWVKHLGSRVEYYEIINEGVHFYNSDQTKIGYFVDLLNAASNAMHTAASQSGVSIKIGCDESNKKAVLDRMLTLGVNLDYISFHRYGNYSDPSAMTDQEFFDNAETRYIERSNTPSSKYLPEEAVALYKSKTGRQLPVIMSEGNLNSWYDDTANPRIDIRTHTMAGAVFTALSIKTFILKNYSYSVYFHYSSDNTSIGMINTATSAPRYSYYAQKMIGTNLAVGDSVVSSSSTSSDIRTLAWNDNGKLKILLIHKSTDSKTISLSGVTGTFNYQKIDNTYSVDNAQVQTGSIDASSITLNGYTVMLLQSSTTPISTTTTKITTTISPTTIPSSQYPVGYWKFDEGSGSTVYDSSPFKNTATLYNNPVWVTGKSGKALQFSGSNYVETPDSSSLDLSSQVTITAWINPSSIGGYNRIVAKSYTSNANPWTMYGLLFDNANHIRLEIATNGQQNAVNSLTAIPLNTWTFVAGTYDGTTMKVYVNGNLDNSFSHTGAIDTNNMPLSIGRSGFGSDYFKGMIDEVKIWNRALTVDEIKNEYGVTGCDSTCKAQGFSSGICRTGTSSGVLHVCGLKLCDDSGNQVYLKGATIPKNSRMKLYNHTSDALPGQPTWFNVTDVQKIKQSGGNLVELQNIALKSIMPTRDVINEQFFVEWIDKWVSLCYQNQVYCVIEIQGFEYRGSYNTFPDWLWQGIPGYSDYPPTNLNTASVIIRDFFDTSVSKQDINRQAFIDAWKFIANRYKNDSYVIFSLINEPFEAKTNLINRSTSQHLGMTYSTLMEKVIDGIRSTGAQQIISIDAPFVWYLSDIQPVNRNNNVTWETHLYVNNNFNIAKWEHDASNSIDLYVQKFVYNFSKPMIVGEYGTWDDSGCVNITGWQNILPEQVAYLDSKPLAGRWFHTWEVLYGEYGWFNCPAFSSTDSDYIIKTVLGGSSSTSSGTCQSGETSIGQDGCSSGQTCCCGFPSTSTTTTIPSGFTGTNFICNYVQTNNLWECSLDYTNNLNEKGLVKFYFIDSVSGEVKSTGSIWTNIGSGTVGSELSCDNYHGTYNVVWRAYRSSDSSRSNPVAFSASFNSITC